MIADFIVSLLKASWAPANDVARALTYIFELCFVEATHGALASRYCVTSRLRIFCCVGERRGRCEILATNLRSQWVRSDRIASLKPFSVRRSIVAGFTIAASLPSRALPERARRMRSGAWHWLLPKTD